MDSAQKPPSPVTDSSASSHLCQLKQVIFVIEPQFLPASLVAQLEKNLPAKWET